VEIIKFLLGCNRAFHRFGQAKFPYGDLVLGSSQFSLLLAAPGASKNDTQFRSGQIQLENNHLALLIKICDTLCNCAINFISKVRGSSMY